MHRLIYVLAAVTVLSLPAAHAAAEDIDALLKAGLSPSHPRVIAAEKARIKTLHDAVTAELEAITAKLNSLMVERQNSRDQIELLRQREVESIRKVGIENASTKQLSADLIELKNRLFEMRLARARHKAEDRAAQRTLALLRDRVEKAVHDDEIGRDLATIVELNEKRLAEAKQLAERGATSSSEMRETQIDLLRSRIELRRHRAEVADRAGETRIDTIEQRLIELASQRELLEAESAMIEKEIDARQEHLDGATKLDEVRDRKLPSLYNEINAMSATITELEATIDALKWKQRSLGKHNSE